MNFIIKNIKVLLTLAVLALGIVFREKLEIFYSSIWSNDAVKSVKPTGDTNVFSEKQLAEYNGIEQNKLYLAVLGSIFDVTEGSKHYAKGAAYNYFVGKDGSRALVTGHFKDESKTKDHILDLSCNDLFSLLHWRKTFQEKYLAVGVLVGRYYDEYGSPTEYSIQLDNKIDQCKLEQELEKKQEQLYPPCNMEWSADTGSRVWCTKNSGGISRRWIGVPRQLYTPGDDKPRCVCVNLEKDNSSALLKEYNNCPATSSSCNLKSS